MKRSILFFTVLAGLLIITTWQVRAQAGEVSKFSAGADVYSNYIWRGSKYGTGPAIQPSVKFVSGIFTIGAWGSFDASGYAEADPYLSLALPLGFSIGLTDYYYPGLEVFDVSVETGSQALEINAGYGRGGLALSANYVVNEAGGAGSAGGDKYFQAAYSFSSFSLFAGAGDGWHTSNGKFNFCNIGLGTTRVINITEKFSIPVTGQVILNPEKEQFFIVVGFTL